MILRMSVASESPIVLPALFLSCVQENKSLVKIDLEDNSIGNEGAKFIGKALEVP